MASPRINIKNIDYFKYKKLVIDGVRDDYSVCSVEVKNLCDCVQTLNFRDEEFDDISDRGRFITICTLYRQIMASKRIQSLDMRIKSAWWGDHKNAYSAGKLKPAVFKDVLTAKVKQWTTRYGGVLEKLSDTEIQQKMEGPGLFVLKHREHQCFQYVGRADRIFARVAEKLKCAYEGTIQEPLAALIVISMAADWDFYFIPTSPDDEEAILRILENDLILKHDSIWPHGLNFSLHIETLVEVSEFRKSCLRHHWPPHGELHGEDEININKLREEISTVPMLPEVDATPPATPKSKPKKKKLAPAPSPPPFVFDDADMEISPSDAVDEQPERPPSTGSDTTYVVSSPPGLAANVNSENVVRPVAVRPGERKGEAFIIPGSQFSRPNSAKRGGAKTRGRGQVVEKKKSPIPKVCDDEDIGSVSQDENFTAFEISLEGPNTPKKSSVPRPSSLFRGKEKSRLPTSAGVRQSSKF